MVKVMMQVSNLRVVNVRKEPCDIYIGRGSIWGNPYHIGKDGTREEVIEKYRNYILSNNFLMSRLSDLRGKKLGCYCKPKLCHGDILVQLVEGLPKTVQ